MSEPHQPPGTLRGGFGSTDVLEGQVSVPCSPTDGQPDSSVLHQPHGGTRSPALLHTACQLWEWCLGKGVTLSAEYFPGSHNMTADRQSRTLRSSAEWRVDRLVFLEVMGLYGPCNVDLFALRLNFQLLLYISWRPDPYATATDAFEIRWTDSQGYAFPPFALIGRYLQKICHEGSTVVLVAPVWPSQSRYPLLLEMLTSLPALLPIHRNLMRDPFNMDHPGNNYS